MSSHSDTRPTMTASGATGRPLTFGRYLVGCGLVLGVVMAALNPQGSAGLGPVSRIVFWELHAFIGLGLLALVNGLLVRVGAVGRLGSWGTLLVSGLLGAALFAPPALALEHLFGLGQEALPESLAELGLWGRLLDELAAVTPPVLGIWVAINLPWALGLDFSGSRRARPLSPGPPSPETALPASPARPPAGEVSPAPGRAAGFLALLPPALGCDLVALSSEMHYLRVHTARGETVILHSLRDAVAALGPDAGMQVHRSHWLATDHVRRVRRRAGRVECHMSNGLVVPVSRRNQKEVLARFGDRSDIRTVAAGDPPPSG